MHLQAAINGARQSSEHSALPLQPDQLAADAWACVAAGAGTVHFHVRAPDGRESLAAADVARAVSAVRAACRRSPIGISTGAWIEADPDRRLGLIRRWHVLPDFASVNFHEPAAGEIAEELLELGVGVEAGLNGAGATAWPLLREAARRGAEARIGLEDTLRLPDGSAATDNVELIRAARTWISGRVADDAVLPG